MASVKSGETRESGLRDYSPLLVFIGVGTCVASILGLFVFSSVPLSSEQTIIEKMATALAMVLGFLLFFGLANRFSSVNGELVSCSLSCFGVVAFSLGAFLPGIPFAAHVACCCVAGAGAASLILVWFVDYCLRPRRHPLSHVAGAFCIGLGIVLVLSFFDPSVRTVAMLLSWCVSCVLSLVQWYQHRKAQIPPAQFDPKAVDSRSRIKFESYVMMATLNAQIGFLFGMSFMDGGIYIPFIMAAGIAVGLVLTIDSARKTPRITERSLFSITTPLTVIAFACLYLFGDVAHVMALCVIAILCVVYQAMGTVALGTHVILERLEPVRAYAKARIINYIALTVGLALGFAAGYAHGLSELAAIQLTVVVALAYAIIASFFHRPRFPDTTLKSDGSIIAVPAQDKGFLRERCFEASEQYGLSTRQFEVLCLIAQGRNAEYVANTLTISVSTAQTHIRNIYQKLDVHSRQELIDMIEDVKLYGED